jgi:N utilization substance protein A
VQAVTNEVGGERVDVIPYNEDIKELIKSALAPAEDLEVKLDKENKTAKVICPEDQLSMAIGKDGQNVRLTAKLTGVRIEVEGDGKPIKKDEEVQPVEITEPVEETKEKKEKVAEDAKTPVKAEPEAVVVEVEKKEEGTKDAQADQKSD